MTTRKIHRRGLQLNASLDKSLVDSVQRQAIERGCGMHALASEVLNLVIECMLATGKSWDDYRKALPGYDQAIAARLAKVEVR